LVKLHHADELPFYEPELFVPDFAMLDLYKYLQEALKTDKIGEAKRYYSNDFHGANFHGMISGEQ
jgi:hypothetical protein